MPPSPAGDKLVRHFRQILLWPLQLMPLREGAPIQKHWEALLTPSENNPWRELEDEFTGDPALFQERHYAEFVTFLPYVQRFLYGEGKGRASEASESPVRVFRRADVARMHLILPDCPDAPQVLEVAHLDLYFFYDIDVVVLVTEVFAEDLPLARAQDILYRSGRCYPNHWDADGRGSHCPRRVEWLAADGTVLAVSDYERREKYLSFVCQYRAPCLASHWEFLLKPLALHHSAEKGLIRYRLLEYQRMPSMSYLALDHPEELTRADFARLALMTAPGDSEGLPYGERHMRDFEDRHCYDRFWNPDRPGRPGVRLMTCGHGFTMVGAAGDPAYVQGETGMLSQFRHQYFLLFLIPHFHKATLLMLSDRLVDALNHLDIASAESVKRFKRIIRQTFGIFLRFSHRSWFLEVSDRPQAKELFRMTSAFLGTESHYEQVREKIEHMSQYLDSDSLRRQANTVVRLTVVTTFGLVGTIATGFLGMNLFAEAEQAPLVKLGYFLLVLIPTAALTVFTIARSKRLSDFLEALSDDRLPMRARLASLAAVWRDPPKSG